MTTKVIGAINKLTSAMLKGMVEGQDATKITTNNMKISFAKQTLSSLVSNATLGTDASFNLPRQLGKLSNSLVVQYSVSFILLCATEELCHLTHSLTHL